MAENPPPRAGAIRCTFGAVSNPRWLALALFVGTFALFARSMAFDFLSYDDVLYVTGNPLVLDGFTRDGVRWAFVDTSTANWYPLTWLSHMLDVEWFGLRAGGHHFTSIGLHALTAGFLLLALARLTGTLWPAALAAALFALHPLRVESVAWIAERKDVLSGLFFALTLMAYSSYVSRPGLVRYLAVAVCLGLGLMAKSMLVTVPCVLLLLDYWPLHRIGPKRETAMLRDATFSLARHPVLEKLPLLLLAVLASLVVLFTQSQAGSVSGLSLEMRSANAMASVGAYLSKAVCPESLAVFYPHPAAKGAGARAALLLPAAVGLLLVLAGLAATFLWRERAPWLGVGWLWFLGMLVPVIGLIQIGAQAYADRYTYTPMIGLALIAAFGADALVRLRPRWRTGVVIVCSVWLVALSAQTWRQLGVWKDTTTLFAHALAVTRDNYFAHNMLGVEALGQGRLIEAEAQLEAGVAIFAGDPYLQSNLGDLRLRQRRYREAMRHLEDSILLLPSRPEPHALLGRLGEETGDFELARRGFARAVSAQPRDPTLRVRLGTALLALGRLPEARESFEAAVELEPTQAEARNQLARLRGRGG